MMMIGVEGAFTSAQWFARLCAGKIQDLHGLTMENEKNRDRSNVHYIKRPKPKRFVSRKRLVMGLLLIVAIPIFIGLANKALLENADAIQHVFGR